jgi:hypothetical protein
VVTSTHDSQLWRVVLPAGATLAALLLGWGCGSPLSPDQRTSSAPAVAARAQTRDSRGRPSLPPPGESRVYPCRRGRRPARAIGAVLHWREYRLPSWLEVCDYTDRFAAILHQARSYPFYSVYLFDLHRGELRQVLAAPVNASRGYLVMEARLSDRWLVWEELSPGDDLASPARWYLYAARVHPLELTIGEPVLVDKGYTTRRSRPLWEVRGDLVAWNVNEGAQKHPAGVLRVTDLARASAVLVRRSPQRHPFPTVGMAGDRVWVSEVRWSGRYPVRVRIYSLSTGRRLAVVPLHNLRPLDKLVAMRRRWLAWALDRSGDIGESDLYALRRPGSPRLVAQRAIEACFVGHYLFYEVYDGESAKPGVDGFDLRTRRHFRLLRSDDERQGRWLLGLHADVTPRTLVAFNPGYHFVSSDALHQATPVRIYEIPNHRGANP